MAFVDDDRRRRSGNRPRPKVWHREQYRLYSSSPWEMVAAVPSCAGGTDDGASSTRGGIGVEPPSSLNVRMRPSLPYLNAALSSGNGKKRRPPPKPAITETY